MMVLLLAVIAISPGGQDSIFFIKVARRCRAARCSAGASERAYLVLVC